MQHKTTYSTQERKNGDMLKMFFDKLKDLWENDEPIHLECIQAEVSAVCNASCAYCVIGCYQGQWTGGLMDKETFEALKPAFHMADLVFLQGWGEPLLHPAFWEMVKAVKATGAKAGFTTNGTFLNSENRTMVLESGIDIMGLSLAGTTSSTHEYWRKGCRFERIDDAMRKLKELRRHSPGQGLSIHIAFMLLKSNWKELDQLPALAERWCMDQIVVSNLNFIGSETMEKESLLNYPDL